MRQFSLGSYFGTYAFSILSIISMLILTGTFSRFWPAGEFLEFAKQLRYLGFIAAVSSFSLGFSIMSKSLHYNLEDEVFPAGFWGVTVISSLLSITYLLLSGENLYISTWVVAVALFHIYISSIRYQCTTSANKASILLKVLLQLLVVLICVASTESPLSFFPIYGGLLLIYIVWDSNSRGFSLNPQKFKTKIAIDLFSHSLSRAIDNISRLAFHVAPVWAADHLIGGAAAGLMVLTLTITKAVESSLQPVTLHLHAKRVKNNKGPVLSTVLKVGSLAILLTIAGYFFLVFFGEFFISLWLTPNYLEILDYIKIAVWTVPAAIILQLLKGMMESRVNTSPFVYINMTSVCLLIALALFYASSIQALIWGYLIIYWLRVITSIFYVQHLNMNQTFNRN